MEDKLIDYFGGQMNNASQISGWFDVAEKYWDFVWFFNIAGRERDITICLRKDLRHTSNNLGDAPYLVLGAFSRRADPSVNYERLEKRIDFISKDIIDLFKEESATLKVYGLERERKRKRDDYGFYLDNISLSSSEFFKKYSEGKFSGEFVDIEEGKGLKRFLFNIFSDYSPHKDREADQGECFHGTFFRRSQLEAYFLVQKEFEQKFMSLELSSENKALTFLVLNKSDGYYLTGAFSKIAKTRTIEDLSNFGNNFKLVDKQLHTILDNNPIKITGYNLPLGSYDPIEYVPLDICGPNFIWLNSARRYDERIRDEKERATGSFSFLNGLLS